MSKENLNNDFDVAVRVQKAFEEATQEKIKNHHIPMVCKQILVH